MFDTQSTMYFLAEELHDEAKYVFFAQNGFKWSKIVFFRKKIFDKNGQNRTKMDKNGQKMDKNGKFWLNMSKMRK